MLKAVYHPTTDTATLYNDAGGWISIPAEDLRDAARLINTMRVKALLSPLEAQVTPEVVQ